MEALLGIIASAAEASCESCCSDQEALAEPSTIVLNCIVRKNLNMNGCIGTDIGAHCSRAAMAVGLANRRLHAGGHSCITSHPSYCT